MHEEDNSGRITRAILDSISEGVFTVDSNWRISSINRAAREIIGLSEELAVGMYCFDVFRSNMCGEDCALRKTLQTGQNVVGRTGFIIKASGDRIPVSVSTATLRDALGNFIGGVETFRDMSELDALRSELDQRHRRGEMSSRTPGMQRILESLPALASSSSTVMIQGETGTGKEVLARAIHNMGPRYRSPFVAVNCGALPETLVESELFGYRAGAFTGATRDKPGRFAAAGNGTIFLDEIAELNLAMQAKLLRALQERTFVPLGGGVEEKVKARILVATNRNLKELVGDGLFREDLFYRINVVSVRMPALRERREDIPLLVSQFVSRFNHLQNKMLEGVDPGAMTILMAYHWPGNIRELENTIERAFVICSNGFITINHLPEEITATAADFSTISSEIPVSIKEARSILDVKIIEATLRKNGFNRARTAADLGVHKTTLFRVMKRLKIHAPRSRKG